MKTKSLFAIGILLLNAAVFADDAKDISKSSENTGGMSAKDMSSMSPKDVCQKLAQLDAKNPAASNQMNMFMYGSTSKTAKTMHNAHLEKEITSADCKSEIIAGNHAFVVAQAPDNQERLLPFVKQSNIWKLDVPAYRELYRMDMRTPASSEKK
ncbi:MAG: hypothetical protein HY074_18795 [Deltaproteobacteria bacterium]|nr:hypothetical protein [Deltaproteobacteria bacterium]